MSVNQKRLLDKLSAAIAPSKTVAQNTHDARRESTAAHRKTSVYYAADLAQILDVQRHVENERDYRLTFSDAVRVVIRTSPASKKLWLAAADAVKEQVGESKRASRMESKKK